VWSRAAGCEGPVVRLRAPTACRADDLSDDGASGQQQAGDDDDAGPDGAFVAEYADGGRALFADGHAEALLVWRAGSTGGVDAPP